MPYDVVAGDTGTILRVTIKDTAGAAVDLTGASAVFRWAGIAGLVEVAAVITDAVNGVVSHKFMAGEITAPDMSIEVEVTDSGGFKLTGLDLIKLTVRQQLG